MAHDVYVSAGIDDAAAATHLCTALEAEGISCWVESRDRDPRLSYLTIDRRALSEARVVIAIHSPAGDKRARVIDERGVAADLALPTIALNAGDIPGRVNIASLVASVRSRMGRVLPVRLFLYAPPGSEQERARLLAVLPRVVASLRNRIRFEPILWDEAPALTPSAYDIVVFFSGTHLHTALPGPVVPGVWLRVAPLSVRGLAFSDFESVAGVLVLYFNDNFFHAIETPESRIEVLAAQTADLNHAIEVWLRRGTLMPELGCSMAGNPPPQFEDDATDYLTEFAKRSLARSLHSERPTTQPTKRDTLGRFREEHRLAKADPNYVPPPPSPPTQASVLGKVHFCAFAPTVVAPSSEFILQVWACRQSDSDIRTMLTRAGQGGALVSKGSKEAVPLQTGTWLTVSIAIPAFWDRSSLRSDVLGRRPRQHIVCAYGASRHATGYIDRHCNHSRRSCAHCRATFRNHDGRSC